MNEMVPVQETLFYIADPMCSWCWGFAPTLVRIRQQTDATLKFRLVLGGLAPDSDEPMPESTRRYVQSAWDAVEEATGARFNRDFWRRCTPRRSTWPACRAVLAAKTLGGPQRAASMFDVIQRAYYLEARNPSDRDTLLELADEIGIDREPFDTELDSASNHADLQRDLDLRDRLGVTGYPTLCLVNDRGTQVVARGHASAASVLHALQSHDRRSR